MYSHFSVYALLGTSLHCSALKSADLNPVRLLMECLSLVSAVVRQLKTARVRAQDEVQRIDAALLALGGLSQRARWAKQKGKS
jgi:hypothetical protein